MPLKIVETPEPLSERSLAEFEAQKPLLIGSDAARVLESELRDYCSGDIAGRSFLIAGHRGAGKSTLVANAFLEVWKTFQQGDLRRRPLFVLLNGPALFFRPPTGSTEAEGDEETEEVESDDDGGTGSKSKEARKPSKPNEDPDDEADDASKPKPRRPPKTDAQIVLEQIVLGLHRAVTREFSRRFWERSILALRIRRERVRAADRGNDLQQIAFRRDTELQLSAQFDAELMDCPEPLA